MDKCGKVSGRYLAKLAAEMAPKPTQNFSEGEESPPLSACSACAGDYEDPDRTAGAAATSDGDETREWDATENELLVEE